MIKTKTVETIRSTVASAKAALNNGVKAIASLFEPVVTPAYATNVA